MSKIPNDFLPFILDEFKRRKSKNPAYSLAAFARDLDLSPQNLNQILKGKSGLSSSAAHDVAKRLSLDSDDQNLFVALVELKHGRSPLLREEAEAALARAKLKSTFKDVTPDTGASMTEWYNWAAYMLLEVKDFKPDVDWISKRLGIAAKTAKQTVENLFHRNLIRETKDGKWEHTNFKLSYSTEKSTTEIRSFYRQMLSKASEAINDYAAQQRHYRMTLFAIDSSDYDDVRKEIDDFAFQILEKYSKKAQHNDRVYAIATAFFPLDKGPGAEG